jgi:hypothetical protein
VEGWWVGEEKGGVEVGEVGYCGGFRGGKAWQNRDLTSLDASLSIISTEHKTSR